jgi:hypothetical protein
LNGTLISQTFQEKISEEVDIPVGRLFGKFAWFRVAFKRLEEQYTECLAACSN